MEKILVIRLSSLGDVLLTTPVLRALRKKYPSSQIDFLVKPQYKDAVEYNPNINQVFEYTGQSKLFKELKSSKYDVVIDLQNNLRSRIITFKLRTKVYRFKKKTIKKFLLVKFKINLLKNFGPIPKRYAEVVPNLLLDEKGLEIFLPQKHQYEISLEEENDNYFIGFCPGSRHFTKRWPAEYFVELGLKLLRDNYKIVLFGGKDDKEICSKIWELIPGSINFQNDDNLLITSSLMKYCKLIVTNDSGLMHAASAVGVPVLVLFGSSVKEFGFAPYKTKSLIIENETLSCRPCSHIGKEKCPKKHFKCMKDLTPQFIYEKLQQFLKSL